MATITVTAYSGVTLVGALSDIRAVRWTDAINGGSGSVTVEDNATNRTRTAPGTVLRVATGGTDRAAFLVHHRTRTKMHGRDLIEVSGPDVRAFTRRAVVYPEYGLSRTSLDRRPLGWQARDYDDSAWTSAVSQGAQKAPTASSDWAHNPRWWPDPNAHWIWGSSGTVAPGLNYFRRQFYLKSSTDCVLFVSADDEAEVWLDGDRVIAFEGPFNWRRTFSYEVTLAAGVHQLAVKARNLNRPTGNSPAGVIVAVAQALSDGTVTDPAVVSVDEVQRVTNDAGLNEIQHVHNNATAGTFTLTFDGQTTGAIAWNAAAATVETALEALSNITNVTVTGAGTSADPWVVTFLDPGKQNVATMTADDTGLVGGTTTITTAQQGGNGGTFTLTFEGQTTGAISWDATASAVETALEALSNIDGVSVAKPAVRTWDVTFDGWPQPGPRDVDLMTADDTGLTGHFTGTTITETTAGVAPTILVRSNTAWSALSYPATAPGMTPGRAMRLLVEEAQARGALTGLTLGFTDANDSDGNAWTVRTDMLVDVGESLERVLDEFTDLGVESTMTPGLQLDMIETPTTGVSAATTTTYTAATFDQLVADATELLVRADDGWYDETSGEAGRSEAAVVWGRLGGQLAGTLAATRLFTLRATTSDLYRLTWTDAEAVNPYTSFALGDFITVEQFDGASGLARVVSITGEMFAPGGPGGQRIAWTIEAQP